MEKNQTIEEQKSKSQTSTHQSVKAKELKELPDYSNEKTLQIEEMLGPFIYDQPPCSIEEFLISRGPVELANGTVYFGQWTQDGQRYGKGVQLWKDGGKYEGYWTNDERCGKGRFILSNGKVYEGQWQNGMRFGKGKMTTNSYVYTGDWLDNEMHGEGEMLFSDGSYYCGGFKNGMFYGFGKQYIDDIWTTYTGEFVNGYQTGKGVAICTSYEDRYEGSIQQSQFNGVGVLRGYASEYFGEFRDGKKNGLGEFIDFYERLSRGPWENDTQLEFGFYSSCDSKLQMMQWEKEEMKREF